MNRKVNMLHQALVIFKWVQDSQTPHVRDAFEIETGQIDGTLAHAIERVVGCATLANGYHLIDTRLAKGIGSPDASEKRQSQKVWVNEWSSKARQRTVDSPFARPTETAK